MTIFTHPYVVSNLNVIEHKAEILKNVLFFMQLQWLEGFQSSKKMQNTLKVL